MVGRLQLVDWSVSFMFENYQNAAKRQFVWELISSEGARFYQKAKKQNKIRRLHVFWVRIGIVGICFLFYPGLHIATKKKERRWLYSSNNEKQKVTQKKDMPPLYDQSVQE